MVSTKAPLVLKKPVQTTRDIEEVEADYDTTLEDQFAALATVGKIRGDWWKGLNSKNYQPPCTGKQKIRLRERCFNQHFNNGTEVVIAIDGNIGEHAADAYMFVAWLRHKLEAGLKYQLAALGQLRTDDDGDQYALCAYEIDGTRSVDVCWFDNDWRGSWWFLVSCE